MAQWDLIELDFQQTYGIDLDANRHRPWRWFRVRLYGLLSDNSTRTWRHFSPDPD